MCRGALIHTIMFADEVVNMNGLQLVQSAPDEVLDTGSFSSINKVLAVLGLKSFGAGLVKAVGIEEGPD